jgi:polysaccharide biosynthesis/export protein
MLAPSHAVALLSTTTKYALRALLLLSCLHGSAALADNAPTPANYRLAAGDTIRITIFQNPDMNLETRVSEDGTINYPLIGGIVIGDLEIGAAERKVAKSLKDGGFLKEPQVNIQLLEIRGNVVAVLGQVNHAGSFPLLTTNTRVSQLLAQAGGVLSTGDDRVVVTGARDGKPFRLSIDIDALYRGQDPVDDFVVAGGDSIYVPRAPLFYIYGEVTKPGSYRIERNMTVRQAIAAGGGLTLRGTERRLRVVRPTAQGGQSGKQPIDLDDLVRPDDVIYVNESLF